MPTNPDHLITALEEYVLQATDALDAGRYEALPGLEASVREAVAALGNLAPEAIHALAPRLDAARRQLDLLKQMMEGHRKGVAAQLRKLSANRNANRAYARSETMIPGGREES